MSPGAWLARDALIFWGRYLAGVGILAAACWRRRHGIMDRAIRIVSGGEPEA